MKKPVLLYYCQHADGMGSQVRAFTIANRLAHRFRVVMLNGGAPPLGTNMPANIELIQLPPRKADIDSDVVNIDKRDTIQSELAVRREMILEKYKPLKPRILLLETFPFGQREINDELMPLIESTRESLFTKPLIVCSVTDILPSSRHDKERRDDRTAELLNNHFDAVIMHSDSSFARLEEFFQPRDVLTTPVHHSGFVLRDRDDPPKGGSKEEKVLVSAGSGIAGGVLFRAAAEAHRLLWDVDHLPMTIVAGPCLPEAEWQALKKIAGDLPALDLKRSVPDLGAELARVRWAVCHCGYNTAVDVLATGVSALLVPGGHSHELQQADRAQRLSHWRVARMIMPRHLNGASLANSIHQLSKFEPANFGFNMDGAEITANIIYELSHSDHAMLVDRSAGKSADRPRVN